MSRQKQPQGRQGPLAERQRSLPRSGFFTAAVAWSCLFYLGLCGIASSFVAYFLTAGSLSVTLLIAFTCLSALLWLASYLSRRKAHCPLCKGSPLLESQAATHPKARRIFPLNFGTSNILKILVLQRFRCQFCGSPFDLLKVQTREHDS